MNTDEQLNDDFLADLIRRTPLESPSEGFVGKVMQGVEPAPEEARSLPWFLSLKSWGPYALAGVLAILVILSSDIPYLSYIPGKGVLQTALGATFQTMILLLKGFLSSKTVSYLLLILASAGFLFIVDRFFARRFAH
jgi:hypothetical protein